MGLQRDDERMRGGLFALSIILTLALGSILAFESYGFIATGAFPTDNPNTPNEPNAYTVIPGTTVTAICSVLLALTATAAYFSARAKSAKVRRWTDLRPDEIQRIDQVRSERVERRFSEDMQAAQSFGGVGTKGYREWKRHGP